MQEEAIVKRNDVPETQKYVLFFELATKKQRFADFLVNFLYVGIKQKQCEGYLGRRRRLQGKDRLPVPKGGCSPAGCGGLGACCELWLG